MNADDIRVTMLITVKVTMNFRIHGKGTLFYFLCHDTESIISVGSKTKPDDSSKMMEIKAFSGKLNWF